MIGTTDTPIQKATLEPNAEDDEIDFLLRYAARYLTRKPTRNDVLSVFAGIRPLVHASPGQNTSALSRDHTILVSPSGLITIAGGKWTTYRRMAQDVIDKAILVGHLPETPCRTQTLPLHGYLQSAHRIDAWTSYGSNAKHLQALIDERPAWGKPLHPQLPYLPVEILWAVRHEMARTLEDVLARRTRALFLDVRATLAIAPKVAQLMAQELGQGPDWEATQLEAFALLAKSYLPRQK
jgi:glycerol-3-phosphate dehydrogenase